MSSFFLLFFFFFIFSFSYFFYFFFLIFFSFFVFFFIFFLFFLFFSFFFFSTFFFLIFFLIFFSFFFLFFGVLNKEPVFLHTCRTRFRPSPFSELRTSQTKVWPSPFSELRTCQTRVRPSSYSELRTCQGSEFGERNWHFSELRTCQTRVIPILSPNSEPAEPGLYPFFLRTPNWNSELRAKTQSWTILIVWTHWLVNMNHLSNVWIIQFRSWEFPVLSSCIHLIQLSHMAWTILTEKPKHWDSYTGRFRLFWGNRNIKNVTWGQKLWRL